MSKTQNKAKQKNKLKKSKPTSAASKSRNIKKLRISEGIQVKIPSEKKKINFSESNLYKEIKHFDNKICKITQENTILMDILQRQCKMCLSTYLNTFKHSSFEREQLTLETVDTLLREFCCNTLDIDSQLNNLEKEIRRMHLELTALEENRDRVEYHRKLFRPRSPRKVCCSSKRRRRMIRSDTPILEQFLITKKIEYDKIKQNCKKKLLDMMNLRVEMDYLKSDEKKWNVAFATLKKLEVLLTQLLQKMDWRRMREHYKNKFMNEQRSLLGSICCKSRK